MKKTVLFLITVFSFALVACKETKTVIVSSSLIICEGVGKQKCMQYKEKGTDNWQLFYGEIEGFTYEEGYTYELEVDIEKVDEPLVDESDLKYSLKKVVKKEKDKLLADNLSAQKAEQDQKTPLVVYDSNTRGFHFKLSVYDSYYTLTKQRGVLGDKSELTTENLKDIKKLIAEIELSEISKIEAPTKLRFHDAAPHTSITIYHKGEEYKSSIFDGGHPPKKIEALVNKILSLAEKK